jgi:DNA-binding beta-propeller fold protein YncE
VVIATRKVTTLAGSARRGGFSDGVGAAARFNGPTGITTDGTSLYVAESWNHTIRKIVISTAEVTTLAGTVGVSGSADGTGDMASFNGPLGIMTDGTSLFVADCSNHTIRQVAIDTGEVTTLTGTAGESGSADGTGASARFFQPVGITTDGARLLTSDYTNNTIRAVD